MSRKRLKRIKPTRAIDRAVDAAIIQALRYGKLRYGVRGYCLGVVSGVSLVIGYYLLCF